MSMGPGGRTPLNVDVSPLQLLLLIQLDGGSKYGYEVLKTIKEEFEGTWEPKTGTLYPALRSLERKGYVETVEKGGTEFYTITPEGRAIFKHMEGHLMDSLDFTVKYLSVVFKWMSTDMKKGAASLIKRLSENDEALTELMLSQFHENPDAEVRDALLNYARERTLHKLSLINKLQEQRGE